MKAFIKKILKTIPIDFTRNQQYDTQTKAIIRKVCKAQSRCIDVGCHKGEVMDIILQHAPKGEHAGFEPIPDLYSKLQDKYRNDSRVKLFDCALSNQNGTTTFNYVVSNPSYSGILKRQYDRSEEQDTQIEVQMKRLDDLMPASTRIDLIKIDVEGGELLVLEGAQALLKRDHPVVIFEHGIGASDVYGSTPEKVFTLFRNCGMKVSLMKDWLNGKPELDEAAFSRQYKEKLNYYFVAHG